MVFPSGLASGAFIDATVILRVRRELHRAFSDYSLHDLKMVECGTVALDCLNGLNLGLAELRQARFVLKFPVWPAQGLGIYPEARS